MTLVTFVTLISIKALTRARDRLSQKCVTIVTNVTTSADPSVRADKLDEVLRRALLDRATGYAPALYVFGFNRMPKNSRFLALR